VQQEHAGVGDDLVPFVFVGQRANVQMALFLLQYHMRHLREIEELFVQSNEMSNRLVPAGSDQQDSACIDATILSAPPPTFGAPPPSFDGNTGGFHRARDVTLIGHLQIAYLIVIFSAATERTFVVDTVLERMYNCVSDLQIHSIHRPITSSRRSLSVQLIIIRLCPNTRSSS
jgi:hypothetical protein